MDHHEDRNRKAGREADESRDAQVNTTEDEPAQNDVRPLTAEQSSREKKNVQKAMQHLVNDMVAYGAAHGQRRIVTVTVSSLALDKKGNASEEQGSDIQCSVLDATTRPTPAALMALRGKDMAYHRYATRNLVNDALKARGFDVCKPGWLLAESRLLGICTQFMLDRLEYLMGRSHAEMDEDSPIRWQHKTAIDRIRENGDPDEIRDLIEQMRAFYEGRVSGDADSDGPDRDDQDDDAYDGLDGWLGPEDFGEPE